MSDLETISRNYSQTTIQKYAELVKHTPQILFQVYSPPALAEATVVRVEWNCQILGHLHKMDKSIN